VRSRVHYSCCHAIIQRSTKRTAIGANGPRSAETATVPADGYDEYATLGR
jgi:hypothetical protein